MMMHEIVLRIAEFLFWVCVYLFGFVLSLTVLTFSYGVAAQLIKEILQEYFPGIYYGYKKRG